MSPLLTGLIDVVALPGALAALSTGIALGLFVGLMPGLSARSTILVAIPFCLGLPPLVAAILLVSIHASAQVSSTIPAVLFGAPTSASEAATAIDGYPMAQRGEGSRAIGAIVSASALGGVGGALVLLLFGALGSQLVTQIGSPEIAALAAGGILAIALISDGSLAGGIALGAAGILAATVGLGPYGPVPRFTFGVDALYDGWSIAAVIAGVIALPELVRRRRPQDPLRIVPRYAHIVDGMLDPFRHAWLTVKSGLIGLVVGITPGIGTGVAVWLAYGHALRTERPTRPFGSGAVEGIIAPEAANGSKEGGSLIPTLYLGIPGSSGMAVLLAAFSVTGLSVGPSMLRHQPELPSAIALTVIIANIVGLFVCLAAAPWMVRLAALPMRYVVVVALVASIAATYFSLAEPGTALQILGFSAFGLLLAWAGLSRPAFLIGFVVGPVFEAAATRSASIYGWSALMRPGVIAIFAAFAIMGWLVAAGASNRLVKQASPRIVGPLLLLAFLFVGALAIGSSYNSMSSFMPSVASVIGLIAAATAIWNAIRAKPGKGLTYSPDIRLSAIVTLALVATAIIGPLGLFALLLTLLPAIQPLAKPRETSGSE